MVAGKASPAAAEGGLAAGTWLLLRAHLVRPVSAKVWRGRGSQTGPTPSGSHLRLSVCLMVFAELWRRLGQPGELGRQVLLRDHHLDNGRDGCGSQDLAQHRLQLGDGGRAVAPGPERPGAGEVVPTGEQVEGGEASAGLKGIEVHERLLDGVGVVAPPEDHRAL